MARVVKISKLATPENGTKYLSSRTWCIWKIILYFMFEMKVSSNCATYLCDTDATQCCKTYVNADVPIQPKIWFRQNVHGISDNYDVNATNTVVSDEKRIVAKLSLKKKSDKVLRGDSCFSVEIFVATVLRGQQFFEDFKIYYGSMEGLRQKTHCPTIKWFNFA